MILSRVGAQALLLSIGMLLAPEGARAATIYVNANAKAGAVQNGTSWETAFASLQAGLDRAASTPEADEIWVAAGTYAPSKIYAPDGIPGGKSGQNVPQMKTFDLPSNVAIYGGFSGDESSRLRRAPDTNQTILSGGETSWHVVIASNDIAQTGVVATLDGLTITGGNANGPTNDLLFHPYNFNHDNGGGITITFESVVDIRNVTFHDNAANGDGGGLFSINSTLRITGSRFIHNSAPFRGGAAEIFNTFEAGPHLASIDTTVFTGNSAGIFGGAIVGEGTLPNDASSLDINNSTFIGNTALEGGAIVFDSQKTTVRNSRFDGNIATVNAGALATTNVVDTIVNATFFGADHVFTKFGTTITNCDFTHNQALGDIAAHEAVFGGPAGGLNFAFGGGALVAYMNGYLDVVDSRFRNNVVLGGDGGAILNGRSEAQNIFFSGADAFEVRTTISGSTFIGNSAPGNGGAVASLPGLLFTIPERTLASTAMSVTGSLFAKNSTAGNGGAIYFDRSTATIGGNTYGGNQASQGSSVYGIGSIINGDPTSPVIQ
jgi:predicted outer membrane repeat protein